MMTGRTFLLATFLALLAGWVFWRMGEALGPASTLSGTPPSVSDGLNVSSEQQPNWARVVESDPVDSEMMGQVSTNEPDIDFTDNQNEGMLLRIELLEERITALEQQIDTAQLSAEPVTPNVEPQVQEQDVRLRLQQAGFESQEIDAIERMQSTVQLQRLELRDTARREGSQNTDEFRQAMRALSTSNPIRESLGDNRYDEYLHASESNNRVMIDEVIPGSAAQQAGILPGDVIYSYAQQRVFRMQELQALTSSGNRGATVEIVLDRNSRTIQLFLPRGPLGVTISGTLSDPR